MPLIRKKAQTLSAEEKKALVDAFLKLKKNGRYDEFVHAHHAVMHPTVFPYEPADSNYRNGAHRGPSFLPWHRAFLLELEKDLRSIDSHLTIPYWDWVEDSALADPATSPVWQDDFLGGNGVESDDWRVASGPFAYSTGNWPIPEHMDGPALRRQFGVMLPTLPSTDDLKLAMSEALYDTPNYNSSPFTVGFRNRLEGWITQRGDSRVKYPGSQLHNRVHLWVGGSMAPMTSPNDPVFFLHHCFIDKIWADWQAQQKENNPDSPQYAPERDGPAGHNLDDRMKPWKPTVKDVLDIAALGYEYEQPKVKPLLFKAKAAPQSPFASPFWAD